MLSIQRTPREVQISDRGAWCMPARSARAMVPGERAVRSVRTVQPWAVRRAAMVAPISPAAMTAMVGGEDMGLGEMMRAGGKNVQGERPRMGLLDRSGADDESSC